PAHPDVGPAPRATGDDGGRVGRPAVPARAERAIRVALETQTEHHAAARRALADVGLGAPVDEHVAVAEPPHAAETPWEEARTHDRRRRKRLDQPRTPEAQIQPVAERPRGVHGAGTDRAVVEERDAASDPAHVVLPAEPHAAP